MLFEIERDACDFALSLGPDVEILEPPALRERVTELVLRMAALYTSTSDAYDTIPPALQQPVQEATEV
jgi:hypothetical protein